MAWQRRHEVGVFLGRHAQLRDQAACLHLHLRDQAAGGAQEVIASFIDAVCLQGLKPEQKPGEPLLQGIMKLTRDPLPLIMRGFALDPPAQCRRLTPHLTP